jgi:beta-galactosidase
MRYVSNLVLLIAIITAGSFYNQNAAHNPDRQTSRSQDYFPMAVWYGGGKARAPMLEADPKAKRDLWRADLQKIKSLGFNAVRCWVDWATAEPLEERFNFDAIDVLTELAGQVGLKVIIQVYADSAPDWVGVKYPDSRFVSISGDVMPSESAPGFCSDHLGVRAALVRFFRRLAEQVKDRPAFLGWDLWSEPHVINWASATYLVSAEFCFCPHSVARYREWLRKKYGSLAALNLAWYRRFSDWNQVEPNRLSTILSYTDYVDWRSFIADKLAEDLRLRFDTVKRVLPDRIATSHAAAPSLFTSPLAGDGNPDDWLMAKQVDYWGTSFYPKHSFPVGRDPAWRGGLLDFSRSASYSGATGFWIGELQGGVGTVALRISSTVTPEDLSVWTWSVLARGAKGVSTYAWYPMSSGYESGGFGLINLDGTMTERAKVAGEIARIVDKNQELFLRAKPTPAEVAIVYNPLSYMVGGRRPLSGAGAQSEFAGIERNSMLGIYRALFPTNVPVDFIHTREIAEGKAARYKLVILPYPLMITEATAKALADYVRNGGTLMAEARLAWNDDRGFAKEVLPGFGLHEVTGCRETALQQTAGGKTEMEITTRDESVPLLRPGDRLRGSLFEEALEPISPRARVIAVYGIRDSRSGIRGSRSRRRTNQAAIPERRTPAIIAATFGNGKTITVGSFLGALYESDRDANVAKFFIGLLDWAGVSRPVEVSGVLNNQNVEVRTMDVEREKLVFIINHSTSAVEPTIRVKLPAGSYQVQDMMTEDRITGPGVRGAISLKKRLAPQSVWVVRLSPK